MAPQLQREGHGGDVIVVPPLHCRRGGDAVHHRWGVLPANPNMIRGGGDITDRNIPKYSLIAIPVMSVSFRNSDSGKIRNKWLNFSRFSSI